MSVAKEIRTKIRSIENTQKITSAMEMVAASKMRRAQDRMHSARPYAEIITTVVSHMKHGTLEYKHPFVVDREPSVVGYIVISTDRGLCGGLNINLFRSVVDAIADWDSKGIKLEVGAIGKKALGFFRGFGANVVCETSQLGDAPTITDLIGAVKVMLDAYYDNRIDRLYLASNRFVNTMTQQPVIEQLIPIHIPKPIEVLAHHWDYIYEPESTGVVNALMERYVESVVYRGVIENNACEQSARMVAMKAATDNAGNLIDELNLIYNKARQAAITQEISEIVGGADAV